MRYLIEQSLIWLVSAGLIGGLIGYLLRAANCRRDIDQLRKSMERCKTRYANAKNKIKYLENKFSRVEEQNKLLIELNNQDIENKQDSPTQIETVITNKGRPIFSEEARTNPDDLQKINGIGPAIEKSLNKIGIFTYQQISTFDADNIDWVNQHLAFPGRIQRDQWIEQSIKLLEDTK